MMTTTVTVNLVIPLRRYQRRNQQFINVTCAYPIAAAAPKNAYVPGVIHGASGAQAANHGAEG